jgi:hypothetical protein
LSDLLAVFAGFAASIVSLIATSYWDHGTTIELWPISILICVAVTSIPGAVWIMYCWFRRRPKLVEPPHWNLKHDSPGVWALTGVAVGVSFAVLVGWTTLALDRVLAQHVGGKPSQVSAHVLAVEPLSGRYRVCNLKAVFDVGWGDHVEACVVPRSGTPIVRFSIGEGDRVVLTITDNWLGSTLSGVASVGDGT